jgi:hypothetical protein
MILAELAGHVAVVLEQPGDGRVFLVQTNRPWLYALMLSQPMSSPHRNEDIGFLCRHDLFLSSSTIARNVERSTTRLALAVDQFGVAHRQLQGGHSNTTTGK